MKKYFALFMLTLVFSFNGLLAKSQTKVGGGFAYGTDIKKPAIQVEADIDINAPITIAPDFKYYFTDEFVTFWEINANVHYVVSEKNDIGLFLLGGLNLASQSVSFNLGPFGGSSSISNTEIGLNLGVGADFKVSSFYITPEVKYVLSSYNQLVIGVSAMFPI
ncbi:hypothetical protein EP342_01995 [bacterium]|nr:MAG: hypothetical protein EP342_01995 [bacterium]